MGEQKVLTEMPKRNPVNGTFELTIRCNLHCKMCLFRHDDCENADIMTKELTAEQWIDLGRQVAEAGTLNLLITGGEPMLRPDFCEIWEELYRQGFILQLYTNATLVTPKIMETLKKYPPHRIGVTIYGASEEIYEKVCGDGEAFAKAVNGVKELKKLPSQLEIRTTVIKDNYKQLAELEQLVKEQFDYQAPMQQPRIVLSAVRGGCTNVKDVRLPAKKNIELFFRRGVNEIIDKVGKDKFDSRNLKFELVEPEKKQQDEKTYTLFGCHAGMQDYAISWDGKLMGCQLLDVFWTDPLKVGFEEAWKQFPFQVKIPPMNEKCQNCEKASHCENCYASRLAETGDICGCPEYMCEDVNELLKICQEDK